MKDEYPDSKSDLFAGFIERCTHLAERGGSVAMITMQSWMFLSSYAKLRDLLLTHQQITSMLHLGPRAFDSIGGEVVSSTAFVLTNLPGMQAGSFVRLVDESSEAEKRSALHLALEARTPSSHFYLASGLDFASVPGAPIVYWLSEKMRTVFERFQHAGATVRPLQGLATGDDSRFLRHWWEVSTSNFETRSNSRSEATASTHRWFPFTKGGGYRRWYGNNEFVVNWEHGGRELYEFRPRSVIRNADEYFASATTWGLITSAEPSFRYLPPGFIFGHKGPVIPCDRQATPMQVQAILNSAAVLRLIGILSPGIGLEVGQVADLPVPSWSIVNAAAATALTGIAQIDWDEFETSWEFTGNPLVDII